MASRVSDKNITVKSMSLKGKVILAIAAILIALPPALTAKNGFDLSNATIPVDKILGGGPPRDGIPALHDPKFIGVKQADKFMRADDPVIAVEINGSRRAYPLRILVWHEIVNDEVAGRPLAVTYCPLCGTAMVFDADVNGRHLTFGVSGLLFQSDVLMYDRQSESLWSQLAMKSVSGPQVGTKLKLLPSRHLTWSAWKKEFPDGEVLSRKTGYNRDYNRDPYQGYESVDRTMFPVPSHRKELKNKDWIAGVIVGNAAAAFPLKSLRKEKTATLRLGEATLQAHLDPEGDEARVTVLESGAILPVTKSYWFAWQAFYPDTALWHPSP